MYPEKLMLHWSERGAIFVAEKRSQILHSSRPVHRQPYHCQLLEPDPLMKSWMFPDHPVVTCSNVFIMLLSYCTCPGLLVWWWLCLDWSETHLNADWKEYHGGRTNSCHCPCGTCIGVIGWDWVICINVDILKVLDFMNIAIVWMRLSHFTVYCIFPFQEQ